MADQREGRGSRKSLVGCPELERNFLASAAPRVGRVGGIDGNFFFPRWSRSPRGKNRQRAPSLVFYCRPVASGSCDRIDYLRASVEETGEGLFPGSN
jgi:hypothetical protein